MQRSVYFRPDLEEKILKEAKKDDISFSKKLMNIIREYFEKKKTK
jgi:hypothetical protein